MAQARGLEQEALSPLSPRASRTVVYVGGTAARERIWIQLDAWSDAPPLALAMWAIVESLTSDRVSRLKQPLLGRSRLAIASPTRPSNSELRGVVTPLDGGLGITGEVLDALRRFRPTMFVHVQDWTGLERDRGRGSSDAHEDAGDGGVLRQIESFVLDYDAHQRLEQPGALRSWLGRPTKLARALRDHPDSRIGAMTMAYFKRTLGRGMAMDWTEGRERPGIQTAVRIGPGRYIPRSAWRRMGAGSLAECALRELGTHGITAQLLGGTPTARAARALAVAEGALVCRLNLDAT